MLSGLPQKSFITASEMFHFGLLGIGRKFSVRKRSAITAAVCDQRGADNSVTRSITNKEERQPLFHSFRAA
jgi:hypothetical protein